LQVATRRFYNGVHGGAILVILGLGVLKYFVTAESARSNWPWFWLGCRWLFPPHAATNRNKAAERANNNQAKIIVALMSLLCLLLLLLLLFVPVDWELGHTIGNAAD
jgi:hypothetical protein